MSRKNEISVLNVLFCLMVIFIHVTSYPITNLSPYSAAVKVLYIFQRFSGVAVYGFIFLSGLKLFLNNGKKIKLKKYYLLRVKRVFIPYLIFTTFYYLYEANRGYFNFSYKELFGFYLNGNVECHLYFVVIIMQFYILYPLWKKIIELKPLIFLPIAAVLNIIFVFYLPLMLEKIGVSDYQYNDRTLTSYLFFWLAGCFCGKNYESFKKLLNRGFYIFAAMFGVFLISETYFAYFSFTGRGLISGKLLDVIHLMYCTFAIMFLYAISNRIYSFKLFDNKLLKSIDDASYEIYLVHIYFVHKINEKIAEINSLGELEAYAVRFMWVYVLSIFICVTYKKIVKFLKNIRKKGAVAK